MIQQATDNK